MNDEENQMHMETASLDARLEALLFASGEMKRTSLLRSLDCSKEELEAAVAALKARQSGGITLIETEGALALVTSPRAAETVAGARKSEWEGELGDAGLEVLAIILYRKEATRSAIEYIRGVNSAATLRILQSKGLIERLRGEHGDTDARYGATPESYAHLGITHVSDLPNHDAMHKELADFEVRAEEIGISEDHHA